VVRGDSEEPDVPCTVTTADGVACSSEDSTLYRSMPVLYTVQKFLPPPASTVSTYHTRKDKAKEDHIQASSPKPVQGMLQFLSSTSAFIDGYLSPQKQSRPLVVAATLFLRAFWQMSTPHLPRELYCSEDTKDSWPGDE